MRWTLGAISVTLMIAAAVCVAQPPADGPAPSPLPLEQRPVIAVLPFEDGAVRGDFGWYWGGRRWRAGVGIADMLTGELVELADRDGTFRVVERQRLYEVIDEQDLGRGGRLDPHTAADIGRILGADLLVMGSVTRFDVDEDSVYLPYRVGFGAERCRAHVALDGRLVDSTTGEIIRGVRSSATRSRYGVSIYRGPLAGFDMSSRYFQQSALGKASERAVVEFARQIAGELSALVCSPHEGVRPGVVVYVEGERVMINRGARDGVLIGDVFLIRREKQRVTDPETGELLTVLYEDIGRLTILDVQEKVSSGPVRPAEGAPGRPRNGDVAVPVQSA